MVNPMNMNSMNVNPMILPHQQVIQINGKTGANGIQLAPNSSVLAMDSTAPIVWLFVSDGVGRVNATPWDISPHKEEEPTTVFENRLSKIEEAIQRMEGKLNESNATESK
jgi:hypothetical protein